MNQSLPPRIVSRKIRWQRFGRSDLDRVSIRLDASAYCTADKAGLEGVAKTRLSELATVRQPTIFGKKEMQGTRSHGIPLYSSSEMLMHFPEPAYFVSKRYEAKLKASLGVSPGTILVSRSGTIGLVTIVTTERDGYLIDDHMIRIIPKREADRGILFTFLSSEIGQQLLESLAYGAVQKEIKAFQLENIEVPRLSASSSARISAKIEKASQYRSEAAASHDSAIADVLRVNKLPPDLSRGRGTTIAGRQVNVFRCPFSTIVDSGAEVSELRLEAHFHNQTVQAAIASIRNCPSRKCFVRGLTARVFLCDRFARTYVEEKSGVAFLSGKNIVQMRPSNLQHVSRTQTEGLDQLTLSRGWILVTRSGTLGRTCLVHRNFEEYIATDHIIRIVADENKVDPAYLYAFLASPYGYEQVLRFRFGSVVDHVTPEQIGQVIVPLPPQEAQERIGDLVRDAYDSRAEALRLETDAQEILMSEIRAAKTTVKDRKYV